jgi:uncharacterized protein YndB with AHSA1/START domain
MKTCSATAVISAQPEKIWSLLTDTSRWPEWDPSLERVEGETAPGGTLKVYPKAAAGKPVPMRISEMSEPTQLTWQGGMPLGLLKDVRRITLQPDAWGATEFRVEEDVSGPMSGMFHNSESTLTRALERFAQGVKRAVESQ